MSRELAIRPAEGREAPRDAASGRPEGSGRAECSELTPAQLELRAMVLASVTSPHSRRNYGKALDLLFAFADGRPAPSTVNVRFAAIRKLVTEARANGMLSAEEAAHLTTSPTSA